MKKEQYLKGVDGEALAKAYLCNQGMTCIAKRYRAQDGEIDLIMDDQGILVFVEVKYRPRGRSGDGLIAVTPSKQRRMMHAAMEYLANREDSSLGARFDVVEITADGVLHVADAFRCL